ncbi:putative 2-nitropropane dioxygenase protein [Botrytis fragariae]|uniref:Putative 2-nitropropane dioxygenase protein n=1 Tax=Botrytis fragariae TaxID=1964551 RepID=A0A8H6AJE0_9HELO|nr:putative 2-nitropropane dioxygenase protein [Botrytis fragariae]KAF5868497.1 putative 2-nitropropane dioxygenase protein [Botrytis fragariae]
MSSISLQIARRRMLETFPWIKYPLVVSAPMLGAATPALATNVSLAGGIGFLAGGNDGADLHQKLTMTRSLFKVASRKLPQLETFDRLPIGIGFQNWGCKINVAVEATKQHKPSAVWLYAPKRTGDLKEWAQELRSVSDGKVSIWVQVGTVKEALDVVDTTRPDVLVIQGSNAGGHGLARSASIISLLPEVADALEDRKSEINSIPLLAAGGIMDGRGVAAAMCLGATGAVMGTRFLAAEEAGIPQGWQRELVKAVDGGVSTRRSTLCDRLKTTVGWPTQYDGRALLNKGHEDERAGMTDEENVRLYKEELRNGDKAWGSHGRMVAYSGTGVGLIKSVMPAEKIIQQTRKGASDVY